MKRMIRIVALFAFIIFLSVAHSPSLNAQRAPVFNDVPSEVTNTFCLKNVYVVSKPGEKSNITNLIIEDGLITQIGTDVHIPSDARIINADSMYVYAGFIDALSHTGIPNKEENNTRGSSQQRGGPRSSGVADPGNPGNKTAGIQPELNVKDLIVASDKSIESMRKAGFTISHVVPKGKMLPGSGAIMLLSGDQVDKMILKEDVSLYSQFTSSGRMYPSTVIGIMAKWRDLYRQAEYAKMHESNYAKFPNGMKRPQYDRATKAFYPIIDKQKSVFFRTSNLKDIYRAMELQEDLSFNIVLAEVKQGWHIADKLKKEQVSVLLSYDLPKSEEKKDDKKDKEEEEETEEAQPTEKNQRLARMKDRLANSGDEMPSEMKSKLEARIKDMEEDVSGFADKGNKEDNEEEKEDDPEVKALKERTAKSVKDYQSQAARFEETGMTFSFSNINGKPKDLKSNLRTMIENGLSEDAALASLTTNPANLLGISDVAGTVEVGKMANLVVSNKPFFDEKSELKFVFVEGSMYDYAKPKKKKKGSGEKPATKLAGKWKYELEMPGDTPRGTMVIKNDDGEFTGTITSEQEPDDPEDIDEIEVDGKKVYFQFTVDNNGFEMLLDFDLEFDDDAFEGSVSVGEFGTFPIKGERIDPEN